MVPSYEDISKQKIAELFEDSETGIPVIGYSPYSDIVRQTRNKREILYIEHPTHEFSKGINMIMGSFGLDTENFINPIDNMRTRMTGFLDVIKKKLG